MFWMTVFQKLHGCKQTLDSRSSGLRNTLFAGLVFQEPYKGSKMFMS
jgi:hypothetical protein